MTLCLLEEQRGMAYATVCGDMSGMSLSLNAFNMLAMVSQEAIAVGQTPAQTCLMRLPCSVEASPAACPI